MTQKPSFRPNVVWLVLDALRARNLSVYGYHLNTTPNLDAFARENILFRRAFVSSNWSIPSHTSMLTGLYPAEHHLDNMQGDTWLNEQISTLPEILEEYGYRTAAFSQNVLFSPYFHFDVFEEFYTTENWLEHLPFRRLLGSLESAVPWMKWRIVRRYLEEWALLPVTIGDVIRWIDQAESDRPFMLMCNLMTMHNSWAPPLDLLLRNLRFNPLHLLDSRIVAPNPFQYNSGLLTVTENHRNVWKNLYDAALQYLDRELGKLLKWLKRWDGWENTIVVITADHGEMLGEYHNLVNHMLSLHDNLTWVPLIIRHPQFSGGKQVESVVQPLSLFSTILDWAGVPDQVCAPQRKRPSLQNAIERPNPRTGFAFSECDYSGAHALLEALKATNPSFDPTSFPIRQIAVRSADNKYVWKDSQMDEFYDLSTDPEERHNLMGQSPRVKEYRDRLKKWQSTVEDYPPRPMRQDLDKDGLAAVEQRLRALGYIA